MSQETTNNLEINWDEEETVIDAAENIVDIIENDKPEIETETPKEKGVQKKEEIVEETTIDWEKEEGEISTDNPENDLVDKGESSEGTSNIKLALVNTLVDKGYLNVEDYLEEGVTLEDLEEEDLQELIDEGLEASQDASIEKKIKDLPPIGKNFLKIVAKGGDGLAYLESLMDKDTEVLDSNLDLTDVENQKKVMSFKLKKEGYDEDYINSFIETLENTNKLSATSGTEFKKIVKAQNDADSEEQERINNIARERREKESGNIKAMREFVATKTEIQGVKLSKKEQSELPEYLFKNKVDVEGGKKITQFYHDLFTGMKDKDNLTLLAKFVKAGFKLDSIKNDLQTGITKEMRQEIQRQGGDRKSKVRISKKEVPLHELI